MKKEALLDTDTLSLLMRKNPTVIQKVTAYLEIFPCLFVSRITVFEVLNGLKAKDAEKQLERFREFLKENQIKEVTELSVELSSDAYAKLRKTGKHSGHDDLLIAGIALANNLVLVTNNTRHFENIEGLELENWTV
jgi:tRNA(fMet)-specific endonuclease VapC